MTPEQMQAEMDRLKANGTFNPAAGFNPMAKFNQPMGGAMPKQFQVQQAPPQAPQQPPQPKQGLLSRLGSGIQNFVGDKEKMQDLQAMFNTMRYAPDTGIQQAYVDRQKQKTLSKQANQTAQYLRSQGEDQLASIVEANPSLAKDALIEFRKKTVGTDYSSKNISGVRIAEEDMLVGDVQLQAGDEYTVTYNPNAEGGYTVNKLGTRGITSKGKASLESDSAFNLADIDAARSRGETVFDQSRQVNRSIDIMMSARDLAASQKGVMTGVFERFLPAFDENTAMFNSLRTTLGIDVINSATFGALSERELDLALSRDIPNTLKGQDLINYLDEKIQAQNKLYREMTKRGRRLQSGIGLSQYMEEQQSEVDAYTSSISQYPIGDPKMTYTIWAEMPAADKKEYLEAKQ